MSDMHDEATPCSSSLQQVTLSWSDAGVRRVTAPWPAYGSFPLASTNIDIIRRFVLRHLPCQAHNPLAPVRGSYETVSAAASPKLGSYVDALCKGKRLDVTVEVPLRYETLGSNRAASKTASSPQHHYQALGASC